VKKADPGISSSPATTYPAQAAGSSPTSQGQHREEKKTPGPQTVVFSDGPGYTEPAPLL